MPRKHIDWSKWDHIIGHFPDARIAEIIGCTQAAVTIHRNGKGIAPFSPASAPKGPDWKRVRDWLGRVPDRIVAEELDISRQRVAAYRKEHGIPSHRSRKRGAEE